MHSVVWPDKVFDKIDFLFKILDYQSSHKEMGNETSSIDSGKMLPTNPPKYVPSPRKPEFEMPENGKMLPTNPPKYVPLPRRPSLPKMIPGSKRMF